MNMYTEVTEYWVKTASPMPMLFNPSLASFAGKLVHSRPQLPASNRVVPTLFSGGPNPFLSRPPGGGSIRNAKPFDVVSHVNRNPSLQKIYNDLQTQNKGRLNPTQASTIAIAIANGMLR